MATHIVTRRVEHGIPNATSCRATGVSPGWLYKWRDGEVSLRRARRRALAKLIRALFGRRRGTYGSPRITADLREAGWRVSEKTTASIMAELGLVPARNAGGRAHRFTRRRNARASYTAAPPWSLLK